MRWCWYVSHYILSQSRYKMISSKSSLSQPSSSPHLTLSTRKFLYDKTWYSWYHHQHKHCPPADQWPGDNNSLHMFSQQGPGIYGRYKIIMSWSRMEDKSRCFSTEILIIDKKLWVQHNSRITLNWLMKLKIKTVKDKTVEVHLLKN